MTLANHGHYIKAVADHLKAAGLPVDSWRASRPEPRIGRIHLHRGDDHVTLYWHEIRGWEYSDSTYDEDSPESLDFAQLLDPPAIVLSSLLSESWTARRMLRDQIPDDEESALAAYAPTVEPKPTGPRPGQQFIDRGGDTWTYVDDGRELVLFSYAVNGFRTRDVVERAFGPLTPVEDVQLPEPIQARHLSCQGLQRLDPTRPIHQGTVPVVGVAEEIARRGEGHVYGCELIGHTPGEDR